MPTVTNAANENLELTRVLDESGLTTKLLISELDYEIENAARVAVLRVLRTDAISIPEPALPVATSADADGPPLPQ